MKSKYSLWINLFILAFGVACLIFGLDAVRANSAKWPSVTGQVTAADVNSTSTNIGTEYYVTVKYEYAVNGTHYTDSFDTGRQSTRSDAEADLAVYVPGKDVAIYYDPNNPGRSTQAPGEVEFYGIIGLIAGVVFIGIGVWSIIKPYVRPTISAQPLGQK